MLNQLATITYTNTSALRCVSTVTRPAIDGATGDSLPATTKKSELADMYTLYGSVRTSRGT